RVLFRSYYAYKRFPAEAWQAYVPEGADSATHKPHLDPTGTITFTLGTLLVMWTFVELEKGGVYYLLLPIGVVVLIWWVWWERRDNRRGDERMVDMELSANRSFGNGALLIGLFFTGYTSVWVSVAIFLQTGHGISALMAALVGVPSAVLTSISSQVAGRYVLRAGRAMVAWGMT